MYIITNKHIHIIILENFGNASPRLNPILLKHQWCKQYFLLHIKVVENSIVIVKFIYGIERVAVLRQGWSILKDTHSAAS